MAARCDLMNAMFYLCGSGVSLETLDDIDDILGVLQMPTAA